MQPQPWPEPAQEITEAVLTMYAGRQAPLPVVVRDELGELFADEQFAEAFGVRGRPGWSPGRLAMITAFQMAENMPDSQAAEAVRLRRCGDHRRQRARCSDDRTHPPGAAPPWAVARRALR
jgi:hypothetical protein